MTTWLDPHTVAGRLRTALPDAVLDATDTALTLNPATLAQAVTFLRDDPELDLSFLSNLTAVDHDGALELVYHLQSLDQNHILTCKAPAGGYDDPHLPSLEPVFHGALLQEREVFDLFGIRFDGHPDLRRIFLWDGFPGYPLRKSFLNMPGDLAAGVPGFTYESGANDWPVPGAVPAEERPFHPNQQSRRAPDGAPSAIPTPGETPRAPGNPGAGR